MRRGIFLLALISVLAARSAAAADPRWTIVRTDSLTIVGDQPPSTLRDIATELEQFRIVVGGLIHNAKRPPALPTVVFVFGTKKAMQPFVPLVNGRPATVAGFFQRDDDVNAIALSLEGFDESAAVAYHEYTHLLVGNAVRSVPVWLNEGLAEYYSTYRLVDGGREAQIGRPQEGRLALLRERSLPLADVIAVDRSSALYNEGNRRSLFYAEAWALTHYILTQMPDGAAAINAYVNDVAEGRTPYEAFFSAFGATPAEFDRRLRVYVQRTLFAGTRFTFRGKVTVEAPGLARALTPGEAEAWLGDLQRRLGRETEAGPRIEGALNSDPDAPIAHLAAGLLRLQQERTNEGLLELERSAALAPNDFLTQYLYGVWLLREDAEHSPPQLAAATAALMRAADLAPESSDAYAWLAYAQMVRDETLADARRSIERAMTLAPGRLDHRLRFADILILQGEVQAAKDLLTKIAGVTTDPVAARGAAARLDAIAKARKF